MMKTSRRSVQLLKFFACVFALSGPSLHRDLLAQNSYTLAVPRGFSTVANHLNHGNNTLAELFPNVPEGTLFYKYDGRGGYTINAFHGGAWMRPNETFLPGEGAFIRNPSADFNVTFTGTKPSSSLLPPIYGSLNFLSFPVPSETALPRPNPGEAIFRWMAGSQTYRTSTFDDLDNAWIPPLGPIGGLGESFFYSGSRSRPIRPQNAEPLNSGTLYFSTYVLDAEIPEVSDRSPILGTAWRAVNAPVARIDGSPPGEEFTAQLYAGAAGTPPSSLVPLIPATKFHGSGSLSLYVKPVIVSPPANAGNRATIVLRVFNGSTFESSTVRGESIPITIVMGGATLLPSNLVGLEGFLLSEPAPSANRITVERTNDGVKLTFTGILQSADTVSGPYADVAGATSPFTIAFGPSAKFFRAKP